MANIKLKNIVKRFGQVEVIKNFNLEVLDREFIVLLGASGCGKTTTLRAIAGLEEIDSGDVMIDDKPVQNLPARDRDIAFVFQLFALYPHLSAFNNIAFPLKAAGTNKTQIEKRVHEVAKVLHIEHLLKSMPSAMSGGDLQRISMARALVRKPKALLMDEPMGTLDAKLREELRTELKHLHIETGSTTVYVTHDQIEAMSMGDRIAIMDDGILQQTGKPKEVYDNPANIFVAQFIGSPVMNMLDCHCTQDEKNTLLNFGQDSSDAICLPKSIFEQVEKKGGAGKSLALGLRPEAVLIDREPVNGRVKATVDVIEPLGPFDIVDFKIGDYIMRGRTRTRFIEKPGEEIWVGLDERKLHFFDKADGQSLNIREEG